MFNSVTMIGRFTADPTLRYTTQGSPVASFRIAVDRYKEGADFFGVSAWGSLGETVATHMTKGRLVLVRGRLQVRQYDDRDGIKRTAVEIIAAEVVFLPDGRSNGSGSENDQQPRDEEPAHDVPDDDIVVDDLPF